MRQIVAGLTGDAEGSADLANELSKADPVTLENGQESEDDGSEPEDWLPDPVEADPGGLGLRLGDGPAGGGPAVLPASAHAPLPPSREVQLQAPLLGHHQPAGEHLWQ